MEEEEKNSTRNHLTTILSSTHTFLSLCFNLFWFAIRTRTRFVLFISRAVTELEPHSRTLTDFRKKFSESLLFFIAFVYVSILLLLNRSLVSYYFPAASRIVVICLSVCSCALLFKFNSLLLLFKLAYHISIPNHFPVRLISNVLWTLSSLRFLHLLIRDVVIFLFLYFFLSFCLSLPRFYVRALRSIRMLPRNAPVDGAFRVGLSLAFNPFRTKSNFIPTSSFAAWLTVFIYDLSTIVTTPCYSAEGLCT